MESTIVTAAESSNKRARSPSSDLPPPSKAAKTHANHLQINYLARQYNENIPLVNVDDNLPSILRLIGDYDGVLHRHESIAGNLGACPLGPILIKRFERLFDGPPRILKSHGREANVTWLDVVEFARNKPEQFNLEKMRNGVRVCQFYTKQSRVEISEEDYVLIASGMPQKLIPPQPIMEDEEKELGALEILEKNLGQIVQLADQVSARARQLNHRLKNRKSAIISRRESEADARRTNARAQSSASLPEDMNGISPKGSGTAFTSQSSPVGFTAVNTRQSAPVESSPEATLDQGSANAAKLMFTTANTDNITIINGTSIKGASPSTRAELMKKFFSTMDKDARTEDESRRTSTGATRPPSALKSKTRSASLEYGGLYQLNGQTAVAIPNTPASLLPHLKPTQVERDDGGPYKGEMVNRMESLLRGERILPPCDRCRRLHMDCLKNLTACMGCTKKHAKCSWKDVREEELRDGRNVRDQSTPEGTQNDLELDTVDSTMDGVQSPHHTPMESSSLQTDNSHPSRSGVQVSAAEQDHVSDIEAAPSLSIGQQLQAAANARARSSNYAVRTHVRESIEQDDDEGDRLQALAAQVYRSASQSVKP